MKTLDDYEDDVCEALGCDDRSDLHREHVSGCCDVGKLLEARDADHRAELLKLQDDLLQGANREVMAAALIERLRGELGAAEGLLGEHMEYAARVAPELREKTWKFLAPNAETIQAKAMHPLEMCQTCGGDRAILPAGSTLLDVPNDECWRTADNGSGQCRGIAAPPPAESTPVHEYVSSRTGACMECGKAIGERPPHLPKPAPPDGILERLYDHSRRLAALETKGEPGTHAFRCQDRHPKDRADCKTEGFDCVCDCGAKRNEHPKGAKP